MLDFDNKLGSSSEDKRASVLIIAARLPLPLNTGAKIRAYHIIRSLASTYRASLAFFYADKQEEAFFKEMSDLGIRLLPVLHPGIDRQTGVRDVLFNFFNHLPVTVTKYWHPDMARLIQVESEKHDVLHCEHLHMTQYVSGSMRSRKVLDSHNVESLIAQRCYLLEKKPARKLVLGWNYRKLLKFEASAFAKCDMVFAVSDADRVEIEGMGKPGLVVTIENGVDVEYFNSRTRTEDGSLVFVGSMDWLPNDDGMRYFLDEILPLLNSRGLNPAVYIVGRAPSPALLAKATKTGGVTVTGTVDDVRPYIESASVYIVPLRFGGGTRLKILEAFAMKKAVVSTSLGCEGIDCRNGDHLLIADSAQQFADSVEMLLADKVRRDSFERTARELVEARYSWEVICKKIVSNYMVLLSSPGATGEVRGE